MSAEKHVFALYLPQLSQLVNNTVGRNESGVLTITDQVLCHRISHILRLHAGESLILFDCFIRVCCQLYAIHKKEVACIIVDKQDIKILTPRITCILPLLKRDDFEQTLAILGSLGVSVIQLLMTDKTNRIWGAKDRERAERIFIAAAEQSKCFAIPVLRAPISLQELCNIYARDRAQDKAMKIYFDDTGEPLLDIMNRSTGMHITEYVCMVGPEGDLTTIEKHELQEARFVFCKLTPTILRSVYAVCLGIGAFRSL